MKRVNRRWLASVLVMLPVTLCAQEPTTRPAVPALNAERTPSFVVKGIYRFSPQNALLFHVASDGKRQRVAFCDAADGTPLFLSDGERSLIYDLKEARLVLVPSSRGYVRIEWDAKQARPLGFAFGVDYGTEEKRVAQANSRFRIDRYLSEAPGLQNLGKGERGMRYSANREGGSVETVEIDPSGKMYRFTSFDPQKGVNVLEMEAIGIGDAVAEAELAFPDPIKFGSSVKLDDFRERPVASIAAFLSGGQGWLAKLGVAGGEELQGKISASIPGIDWAALKRVDGITGEAYRKALAEQGIEFGRMDETTQPSR